MIHAKYPNPIWKTFIVKNQNFNKMVNNQTSGIKFENIQALCDILECTPNDLFEEYYKKK